MNDLRSPGVIEKIKPKWTYIQGRLHEVKLGCRNPRERCDAVFWKIANRAFIACCGKIFCERSRENFWWNCFGKILVKSKIAGVEIFADGILWRERKSTPNVRGLGGWPYTGMGRKELRACDHGDERTGGSRQIKKNGIIFPNKLRIFKSFCF